MKKNITINLCGRLFNIDEDAYELLGHYIDTLRAYFAKQEGGEEIADDIEMRIAELLEELKSQGIEAVNIEHVKEIVRRIGKPEEMDDSPTPDHSADAKSADGKPTDSEKAEFQGDEAKNGHKYSSFNSFFSDVNEFFRERRFYRNPKDKMVAGVLSGLASSFEIDVTLLRLLVIVGIIILSMLGSMFKGYHDWLVFFNANVFLTVAALYAIMAIVMPEAETPEQQLKMQGKPVNMQNLAEEVVQNVGETDNRVKQSSGIRRVFNGILKFFASIFKFLMVLLAIALFAGGVFALIWGFFAMSSPETVTQFSSWDMQRILPEHQNLFMGFLVALLIALLIPAYAIVQHLIRPLKIWQRLVLILVWIVALITAATTGAILTEIDDRYERDEAISLDQLVETEGGVTMKLREKEFLDQHGWRILNGEGCNDRFTAYGEYYLENRRNSRYLDCYDDHHRQHYRAERGESLTPGRYKLTCAARANGRGAFVYTLIDGKTTLQEIPATGNVGGDIWQAATDSLKEVVDSLNRMKIESESMKIASKEMQQKLGFYREISRANDGKGYGWNRIAFEPIVITKPHTVVCYGLTTDPEFTGQTWLGQWFSACDFIIERIGD